MNTLQDICLKITDGKHGDCQNESGSGYYFISCKDVKNGCVDYSGARQITEKDYLDTHKRTQLEPNDILITNSGTIGRIALVSNAPETCRTTFQKSVAIVKPNQEKVIPRWLYFCLIAKKDELIAWAGGTAQKNLLLRDLRAFEIETPPLSTQRKISFILSAYENLIENNQRRIEILEEMAQNLYREWFVKFRFPGYENVRFADSRLGRIPERWKVSTLGEHLESIGSGKRPKGGIKDLKVGVPSVGAENIFGIGRHKYQNEKYVPREFFERMKKGVVKDGDVALYKDGAYIGRSSYFRDGFPHTKFCVNEHVFLLHTTGKRLTQNILYLWLQEPDTVSGIRATNANAAQPGINQAGVNGLSLIVPPLDISRQFDQLTEPIFTLIINMAKRDETLRSTRNLLLSKLISGEVDVSELDIAVPEEAEA